MSDFETESIAQDRLQAFIKRLERLAEERQSIAGDMSEVFKEAKGDGFDVPTLKAVLKIHATSGAATRKDAGTAAPNPITDLTQPNPICRDPGDCGVYASWHHPCLACTRAARAAA